jgi:hypothetical protein
MSKKKENLIPEKKTCRYCHETILNNAIVCCHCGHFQNLLRDYISPTNLVAVLLLILTGYQAYQANESNQSAKKALREIEYTLSISDAAARMRIGMKAGLLELQSFDSQAYDENIRFLSRSLLQKITADYDSVVSKQLITIDSLFIGKPSKRTHVPLSRSSVRIALGYSSDTPDSLILSNLLQDIESNENLDEIASDFVKLRFLTSIPFKMFDFDFVNKWKSNIAFSKK